MKINVPWNEANIKHDFRALLIDEDGNEVIVAKGSATMAVVTPPEKSTLIS